MLTLGYLSVYGCIFQFLLSVFIWDYVHCTVLKLFNILYAVANCIQNTFIYDFHKGYKAYLEQNSTIAYMEHR